MLLYCVYYYNGAQRYDQFLQVGRLYRALILLGLALCLPSTSVSSVFMVLCILFLFTSFFLTFSEISQWDWPLTWLTNHLPSVLNYVGWVIWPVKSSSKWPTVCRLETLTLLYDTRSLLSRMQCQVWRSCVAIITVNSPRRQPVKYCFWSPVSVTDTGDQKQYFTGCRWVIIIRQLIRRRNMSIKSLQWRRTW